MKVIKPQRLGLLTRTFENDHRFYFVVTTLVFFELDQPTPLHEINFWRFVATELGKNAAIDACMPKQRGEIVVSGKAYPHAGVPQPAVAARLAMGSVDKTVWVVGHRRWRLGGVASDPEPFTEMAITWENAFGGEGFAKNPSGKGYRPVTTDGGVVHALPNVEDREHLIKSPSDEPEPAGFAPYDLTWPSRFAKMGTHDKDWLDNRFPGFAKDLDWSMWNLAPIDQQIEGYFQGDEAFVCENMHPTKGRIESKLPGLQTRAFITHQRRGESTWREIVTRLDTVHLFPHVERGVMIYRGMLEIGEDDGADVAHVLVAAEDLGAPRDVEHYQAVLAKRLDKRNGAIEALRDSDLMPPPREGASKAPDAFSDMDAIVARDRLLRQNMQRKQTAQLSELRESLKKHGLDPDEHLPKEVAPDPEPPKDLDAMPDFIAEQRTLIEATKRESEEKKKQAEESAREACKRGGVDYDEVFGAKKQRGGPPEFSAKKELDKLREDAKSSPAAKAQLDNPDLEKQLVAAEAQLVDAYRRHAHHFPAAERLAAGPASALRTSVLLSLARGESLANRDLTGADLHAIDFKKRDLRGAMLEAADLRGATFDGADLTGAVLTRADISEARFCDAKLLAANLGCAIAKGTRFDRADMTGAQLFKADLTNASLASATLVRAHLGETRFEKTDLAGVTAPSLVLLQCSIAGASLAGADLSRATFLEVDASGVDFTGAKLSSSTFVTSTADKAVFRGANLENFRAVKDSSLARADLRGALLDRANLRGTNLEGADFTRARLEMADLSECNCKGAVFKGATAPRARFVRTNLEGAQMQSMNLMNAILQKANLDGTNLEGANLFRADLARVEADDATSLEGAHVKQVRVVRRKPDEQS